METRYYLDDDVQMMPIHPGLLIQDELKERKIKQREFANLLGMPAPVLNDLIKGKRNITPEIAVLLEEALGISAEYWMRFQVNYELDVAKKSQRVKEKIHAMHIRKQKYTESPATV